MVSIDEATKANGDIAIIYNNNCKDTTITITAILGKLNCVLLNNKGWKQLRDFHTILSGVSSNKINYHGFDFDFSECRTFVFYV